MSRSMDAVAPWRWAALAALASLWGLHEVFVSETLVLRIAALFLLAVGRTILNLPGTSLAMAGVAVLFRAVNADPFYCHLAGVALLGAAFDVSASRLLRGDAHFQLRGVAIGLTAPLLGAFLFAGSMAWIFEYRHWPERGLEGVLRHTFITSGISAALAGILVVPLGLALGRALGGGAVRHPAWSFVATASVCALVWLVPVAIQ